eukprot:6463836-Amphidinium_carterae.3
MMKDYYTSLLSLYNVKENTNSPSTTGTKQPPITTGELLDSEEHSTYRTYKEQETTNYISGQSNHNEPYIKAYRDSDWAGCSTTRKLTTSTVLQLAGVTIATSSKTQQVIYVRNFLHELNFTTEDMLKPQIYTDSSSAKCLTQQLDLTKRTKHIDMRYFNNYTAMENWKYTKSHRKQPIRSHDKVP